MSALSPDRAEVRVVEVQRLRIRVSVRGAGRPVLFITGLGAGLDAAAPFERELCRHGFQVISFDAPGMGQSSPYRSPRRMPGLARTIEQLLTTLGYERVDAVGISLGGAVAQQLAHQAPDRLRRLVLASTAPGVGGILGDPRVLMHLATPRRYYDKRYFDRIAGLIYGGEARRSPKQVPESLRRFVNGPSLSGYFNQLYAISWWTSVPWLRRIRQPTLVLSGDDDPIVPVVNGRILAALIPKARLHVVRGGGHLFMLERAEETAAVVADFLR